MWAHMFRLGYEDGNKALSPAYKEIKPSSVPHIIHKPSKQCRPTAYSDAAKASRCIADFPSGDFSPHLHGEAQTSVDPTRDRFGSTATTSVHRNPPSPAPPPSPSSSSSNKEHSHFNARKTLRLCIVSIPLYPYSSPSNYAGAISKQRHGNSACVSLFVLSNLPN
jgi:hypothetical protein